MLKITIHDLIPDYEPQAEPWTARPTSDPQEPAPMITTDIDLDNLLTMPIDQVIIRAYLAEAQTESHATPTI